MTNAQRGTAHENRAKARLERDGYFVVRSAGSKGAVDLIAVKAGQILMIQCKLDDYMGPKEWNRLLDIAQKAGGIPLLYGGRGRVWRLAGRKDGSGSRQPLEPFVVDQAAVQSLG